MENITESQKAALEALVTSFFNKTGAIKLISVCTSDGFDLFYASRKARKIEGDKIAAVSSTLCSISSASADKISSGKFKIATIESDIGNILFLRTKVGDIDCALCVEGSINISLGTLRFISQRLAKEIEELK